MKKIKYTIGYTALVLMLGLFMSFNKNTNVKPLEKETNITQSSGKEIYAKTCLVCHQSNGQGIPGAFPPLAKSDYLNADVNRAIETVLYGKTGKITVNGTTYNSVMTPQALTDQEVADVLTYIYNSWGNNKTKVTLTDVKKVKK